MGPLPLTMHRCIFAVIELALLPLLCDGVVIIDVQASVQSRRLCRHCNNIDALVTMALLLLSSWCCRPHHNGVVAIINSQVSLPLSQWRHCPLALAPLPTLRGCCGVVAPIALTSLPSHQVGIVTAIAPPLLPLLSWCVCNIALVSLPLSC
jgi:hypothetical protein